MIRKYGLIICLCFVGFALSADTTSIIKPSAVQGNVDGSNRSKQEIMKMIMQNLAWMRNQYLDREKEIGTFSGRIYVRFKIDSNGSVFSSEIDSSTISDSLFSETIRSKVLSWKFSKLTVKSDTCSIIYPFIFNN